MMGAFTVSPLLRGGTLNGARPFPCSMQQHGTAEDGGADLKLRPPATAAIHISPDSTNDRVQPAPHRGALRRP